MTFKDEMQRISKVVAKAESEVFFEKVAKEKIIKAAQAGLTKVKIERYEEDFEEAMLSPYFQKYLKEFSGMSVELETINAGTMTDEITLGVIFIFDWSGENEN